MVTGIDMVVWDFDGVLNVNPGGEVFPWVADLKQDLGIAPDSFRRFLNVPGQARDVLKGEATLTARLRRWIEDEGHAIAPEAFLEHWLVSDDRPDEEAVGWLDAHAGRKIIATNNPPDRAGYITARTRAGALVETVLASGEIGVAKPDPGFFRYVEGWAGVPPARLLLIDDSDANVAEAARRGWKTFRFDARTRDRLPQVLGL